MAVEVADYPSQLDEEAPAGPEPFAEGDNHLRLIKHVFKATFSGVSGAVTATQEELNLLAGLALVGVTELVTVENAQTIEGSKTFNAITDFSAGLTLGGDLVLNGASGTNKFAAGTGDGASYTTYNVALQLWFGLGLQDHTGAVQGFYNARSGTWDVKGGYYVNGVRVPKTTVSSSAPSGGTDGDVWYQV